MGRRAMALQPFTLHQIMVKPMVMHTPRPNFRFTPMVVTQYTWVSANLFPTTGRTVRGGRVQVSHTTLRVRPRLISTSGTVLPRDSRPSHAPRVLRRICMHTRKPSEPSHS